MSHEKSEILSALRQFPTYSFSSVEVSILDESRIIDRYVGILGLRDAVSLTRLNPLTDRCPVDILEVVPSTYEMRLEKARSFDELAEKLSMSHRETPRVVRPQPRMSPQQLESTAQHLHEVRSKKEQYVRLSRNHKLSNALLYLMDRESCYVPTKRAKNAAIPDVLVMKNENYNIIEVIVSEETEELYKALPPHFLK